MVGATKPLRPFFSYYGGKWRDAVKLYPAPTHERIIEPFAGSAGYSLRNYDRTVVLYEIDPVVVAVWKYLIAVKSTEILAIPDLGKDENCDDLKVCQEARWLVGFWLNRAVSSPRKSPSAWMRAGIRPGSFWGERVRNTIASQVDSIRHWEVHNSGYIECPDDIEASWFIDPPYQVAGRHYRFGSEIIDYQALGEWCQTRKGQVIVCENEGADWLPFRPLASTKTTRTVRSAEVYWLNSFTSEEGEEVATETKPAEYPTELFEEETAER